MRQLARNSLVGLKHLRSGRHSSLQLLRRLKWHASMCDSGWPCGSQGGEAASGIGSPWRSASSSRVSRSCPSTGVEFWLPATQQDSLQFQNLEGSQLVSRFCGGLSCSCPATSVVFELPATQQDSLQESKCFRTSQLLAAAPFPAGVPPLQQPCGCRHANAHANTCRRALDVAEALAAPLAVLLAIVSCEDFAPAHVTTHLTLERYSRPHLEFFSASSDSKWSSSPQSASSRLKRITSTCTVY